MRKHWTRALSLALITSLVGLALAWPFDAASAGAQTRKHPRRHSRPHRAGRHGARLHLIWDDEFSGPRGAPADHRKWHVIYGGYGFGNSELQFYTGRPRNLALDGGGHLVITALRERYRGRHGVTRDYTAAALQTKGLFQVTYGRLEARIEFPDGKGLWPAFWAVGGNVDRVGWPRSGEIDMMENVGNDPFSIYGSIHGAQSGRSDGYGISTRKHTPQSLAGRWHVYGVTWGPGKLVFTMDGVPYATYTPSTLTRGQQWAFNHPFFLIVNLAVGGTWPGSPDASTPFPARMRVDWVRVYSG